MEAVVGVLAFMVAILSVLQGYQMLQSRRSRRNPNSIAGKLDIIVTQLGRMEQRLNDIWGEVKKM